MFGFSLCVLQIDRAGMPKSWLCISHRAGELLESIEAYQDL